MARQDVDFKRTIRNVDTFEYDLLKSIKVQKMKKGYKRKKRYLDLVTAFDIETSNIDYGKNAIMYIWMYQICGYTVIGRTWDEFQLFLSRIDETIADDVTIVCYIFNLAFEFQFMKSIIPVERLMALDDRKVLTFDSGKFEFRCAYLHSNMNLRKFLESQNVEHQKTELDYSITRYPWTELSDKELEYCVHDVLGLVEGLEHEMKMDGDDLTTIPLTSTGYIRRKAKKVLGKYKKMIQAILPDLDVMTMLRKEFRGGNTHANVFNANYILDSKELGETMNSWDMSSAYPACILSYKYPYEFYEGIPSALDIYLKHGKAVLLDVILTDVKLRIVDWGCPYIPIAKCDYVVDPEKDNGRVRSCKELRMTINEIDLEILNMEYEFNMQVLKLYHARKDYLPQEFLDLVLEEYKEKTKLKGVDDYLYGKAKNRFNSLYGMCVQNVMKTDYVFEDGNIVKEHYKTPQDLIDDYHKHGWIAYQWGCWITSYARLRLELGIGIVRPEDFLYCDTDSVKVIGDYSKEFKELNKLLLNENAYAIDNKGKKHYIGIYEKENDKPILKWVSMGAKKYCYEDSDGLHLTLSGVSKSGVKELGSIDNFKEGFIFRESAGNESYYNDDVDEWIKIDGHDVHVTSNVAIYPSTYELGLTMDYRRLLYAVAKLDLEKDLYYDIQPSIIYTTDED